jgi:hypothetical protein
MTSTVSTNYVSPSVMNVAKTSLAYCTFVASLFLNTDTSVFSQTDPLTVLNIDQGINRASVSFPMENCYGTSRDPSNSANCKWDRKLRVHCFTGDDSNVYMRVQTNSMPDHSFVEGRDNWIKENFIDFEV